MLGEEGGGHARRGRGWPPGPSGSSAARRRSPGGRPSRRAAGGTRRAAAGSASLRTATPCRPARPDVVPALGRHPRHHRVHGRPTGRSPGSRTGPCRRAPDEPAAATAGQGLEPRLDPPEQGPGASAGGVRPRRGSRRTAARPRPGRPRAGRARRA